MTGDQTGAERSQEEGGPGTWHKGKKEVKAGPHGQVLRGQLGAPVPACLPEEKWKEVEEASQLRKLMHEKMQM